MVEADQELVVCKSKEGCRPWFCCNACSGFVGILRVMSHPCLQSYTVSICISSESVMPGIKELSYASTLAQVRPSAQ